MDRNRCMIAWSSAWALVGGVVACTNCMQSQSISRADQPFPHDPACGVRAEVASRPWVELHEILDKERG